MKTSVLISIVIALVVVVSLLAVWLTPSVQDFMAGNTMWNGVAAFTEKYHVDQLDSLGDLPGEANNNILICIPYLEYSPGDLAALKQFVENGNTLVLLDDFGYGNDILSSLGVSARFDHSLLLDPLFCYKNPYLPRIVDLASPLKDAGITAVALNHATFVDNVEPSQALAWSSSTSFADANQNGSQDKNEPAGPFAVAAEIPAGQGTLKLVSDPSLIINSMADQNDNEKLVGYLTQSSVESGSLWLDRSHLSKSPLDTSKINLEGVRKVLSQPYALVGVIVVIFVLVTCYTIRKGEIFG